MTKPEKNTTNTSRPMCRRNGLLLDADGAILLPVASIASYAMGDATVDERALKGTETQHITHVDTTWMKRKQTLLSVLEPELCAHGVSGLRHAQSRTTLALQESTTYSFLLNHRT